MASIQRRATQSGPRYDVCYRDPDGKQRRSSFRRKVDAERFAATTEADKLRGSYVDASAGKVTFRDYAATWLAARTFDESTREAVALRLRLHAYPVLGGLELRQVRPSVIQAWLHGLQGLAPSYRRVVFANVSSIFVAAVDDGALAKNPCRAASVRRPQVEARKVVPWTASQVRAVRDALPARWRIVAVLGSGLGLRQGEVFGLSPDDVDFLRGRVEVRRQVRVDGSGQQSFGPLKGRKSRTVPLPASVRDELAAYLAAFPARTITLPWGMKDGAPTTVPLIVTTRERTAANRNYFNARIWKPALGAAGLPSSRENGCHALRHWYASALLDAGESIKAVSSYLGHADPAFTLRTYAHVMPASEDRTRHAVDAALACDMDVASAAFE